MVKAMCRVQLKDGNECRARCGFWGLARAVDLLAMTVCIGVVNVLKEAMQFGVDGWKKIG